MAEIAAEEMAEAAVIDYKTKDPAEAGAFFRTDKMIMGSWFAYAAEVRSEGRVLIGCAVHNPAMPAP